LLGCFLSSAEDWLFVKKLLTPIIVVGLLVGAYFLLRTRVLWLDSFEGTISERSIDEVATVKTAGSQTIASFFLSVETDDGRSVVVPSDQLQYFRARRGMRVHKAPFSSSLVLESGSD
jgi:hypothetical protein